MFHLFSFLFAIFLIGTVTCQGGGEACVQNSDCVSGGYTTCQAGICVDTSCVDFTSLGSYAGPPSVVSAQFELRDCGGNPLQDYDASVFFVEEDATEVPATESSQNFVSQIRDTAFLTLVVMDFSRSVSSIGYQDDLLDLVEIFVEESATIGDFPHSVVFAAFDGSRDLDLLSGPTTALKDKKKILESLRDYVPRDGASTNLYGAVFSSLRVAQHLAYSLAATKTIISVALFTDGADTADIFTRTQALNARSADEFNSIAFFSVAVGNATDISFLQTLAGSPARFINAPNSTSLSQDFAEFENQLSQLISSVYFMSYCSPKRGGGNHALSIGFLLSGDTMNLPQYEADFFGPGCSTENPMSPCESLGVCGRVFPGTSFYCGPCFPYVKLELALKGETRQNFYQSYSVEDILGEFITANVRVQAITPVDGKDGKRVVVSAYVLDESGVGSDLEATVALLSGQFIDANTSSFSYVDGNVILTSDSSTSASSKLDGALF